MFLLIKGKRNVKIEFEEGQEREEDAVIPEDNFGQERMFTSLSNSHYYPKLTFIENVKLNLSSYQSHINGGLATSDLK